MRHAYFINVRKSESNTYLSFLADGVDFAVYVSAGFLKMYIIHCLKNNTLRHALARLVLFAAMKPGSKENSGLLARLD